MQDAVDACANRLDLRRIGQLRRLEFFACAEIGRRPHVAQQQVRIDRRQQLAQGCANSPRRAGHQYSWHLTPRFGSPKRVWRGDSGAASDHAQHTAVIPRESGVSSTPRLFGSITSAGGILDRPLSRTMTLSVGADLPPRNGSDSRPGLVRNSNTTTRTANVRSNLRFLRLAAGGAVSRTGRPRAPSAV